jgi:phage N-6-adenine-methyltransferase
LIPTGSYAWINPPYSDIGPWIALAEQLQTAGIGTVLLVMSDSSVGWYYRALRHCSEIREVVKGRISFLNPETGKPVSGNNKGSTFLIYDPYGRHGDPRRTYVERDALVNAGAKLMTTTTAQNRTAA